MMLKKGIAGILYGKRLPRWQGVIQRAEVRDEIVISRDRYGIPTICALNQADAWYGLGFCQAQDRAFQLEVYRRQATGTLSALFGVQTLSADRLARTIGFRRVALKYLERLDPEERSLLDHFIAGVNAGLEAGCSRKPHEFGFLEAEPSAHEVVDPLALCLLLAFSLTHWTQKVTRLKLALEGGQEAILGIDPGYPAWKYLTRPVGQKAGQNDQPLMDDLKEAMKILGKRGYSNNWVISAALSRTGNPLLANDPHLGADIPAPWYLARLKWADQSITGACYPGTPFFLIGHNRQVSWGLTAAFIDNTDLFMEHLSADGKAYFYNGKKHPVEFLEEVIEIRGAQAETYHVGLTAHGPLLTPLELDEIPPLSFQATWMRPGGVGGFFKIHQAGRVQDIGRIFRDWPLMSLNLVCADSARNIGWFMTGRAPRRKKGNGLLPMPGWTSRYGWYEGYAALPSLVNPKAGFIATANNKPVDDRKSARIGFDYIDGYRHGRIIEILTSFQGKFTLEECLRIQQDIHSPVWAEIRETILAFQPAETSARKGLELLKAWDGNVGSNSAAAVYFEVLLAHILSYLDDHYAGKNSRWTKTACIEGMAGTAFGIRRVSRAVEWIREQPREVIGPDPSLVLGELMAAAWQVLSSRLGNEPSKWEWGRARPLVLKHFIDPFLKNGNPFITPGLFNLGPFPIGGDEQCVAVAAGDMLDPFTHPNFIPNLRMAVEAGPEMVNSFSLAGGISGNPFSRHYSDLMDLWRQGKGVTIGTEETSPGYQLRIKPVQLFERS